MRLPNFAWGWLITIAMLTMPMITESIFWNVVVLPEAIRSANTEFSADTQLEKVQAAEELEFGRSSKIYSANCKVPNDVCFSWDQFSNVKKVFVLPPGNMVNMPAALFARSCAELEAGSCEYDEYSNSYFVVLSAEQKTEMISNSNQYENCEINSIYYYEIKYCSKYYIFMEFVYKERYYIYIHHPIISSFFTSYDFNDVLISEIDYESKTIISVSVL